MLFKNWIIAVIITFLILVFASIGQSDMILENTGKEKMTVWVYWINHPYGCQTDMYGVTRCEYALAVGEMEPGKVWKVLKGPGWWTPGNVYLIIWRKPLETENFYAKRFMVTDYLVQIYMNQNAFGEAYK